MRRWYLRRAIPWAALLTCCGLAVVAWGSVHRWPATGPMLLPLMVACCAAACGFVFDEPATAVTSVTPRGSVWARACRLAVAGVPLAVLVLLVAATPDVARLDLAGWSLAGTAAVLLTAGTTGVAARRHVTRPGPQTAGAVVLVLLAPTVLGNFLGWDPVLPPGEFPAWTVWLWSSVAVAGAALLVVALRPAPQR